MVYEALPPLPPSSQQMPNGTAFFPSAIIDNSPPTLLASAAAASVADGTGGDGEEEGGGGGCANGAGALFSFGWPQNGTTAAQRAEGWRALLAGVPGLPPISSVVGQAWAEEPYVMGAYGAWWPPGVVSAAGERWSAGQRANTLHASSMNGATTKNATATLKSVHTSARTRGSVAAFSGASVVSGESSDASGGASCATRRVLWTGGSAVRRGSSIVQSCVCSKLAFLQYRSDSHGNFWRYVQ